MAQPSDTRRTESDRYNDFNDEFFNTIGAKPS
jgi:hypothetical protein